MNAAEKLSAFLVKGRLENVPEETVIFIKQLIFKTVAGMLAGTRSLAGERIINYFRKEKVAEEVSVIGYDFKTSLEKAVLMNGISSHTSELEDNVFPGAVSDITLFPVIFPLAEKLKLTGKEFLEACIYGFEVMNRIAIFAIASKGLDGLPYYGPIGAAAISAKALRLTERQAQSAVGIAIGRAAGTLTNFGTDAHYLQSAFACRDGLDAGLLAKADMTGGPLIEKWLGDLFEGVPLDFSPMTTDLGKAPWFIHKIWVKKYPCCFLTHRQLDILSTLKKEKNFSWSEVASIEAEAGPLDGPLCDRPSPKTVDDAKFSFQHVFAAMMIDGAISIDTFTPEKVTDPQYIESRKKISVKVHKNWPRVIQSGVAKVSVILKSGKVLSGEMEQPFGGEKLPLSHQQFVDLFNKFTKGILTSENGNKVINIIMNIEKYKDLKELNNIITAGLIKK